MSAMCLSLSNFIQLLQSVIFLTGKLPYIIE